jgi:5-methylcytosine-specific restriction endonuclease McrA
MLLTTAANYAQCAKSQTLDAIPRNKSVGAVSRDELENLYSEHMSATGGAARRFYNTLRALSPNRKCPLCGVGTVTILDHHLPKSKYPDLSVCPFNLVPACDFCNNAKKAKYPETSGQQSIHPYYDDFTGEQWVFARLNHAGSPALEYYVQPPQHWSKVRCERAQRHFDVVKLGDTYTSNANDDMITLREPLISLANAGGPPAVQAHLSDERDRYAQRINSWQHAMYQALSQNAWFISGGYVNIEQAI